MAWLLQKVLTGENKVKLMTMDDIVLSQCKIHN